jgi:sortase B
MKKRTRKIIRFIGIIFIIAGLGIFGWEFYQSTKSKGISQDLESISKKIDDELPPQGTITLAEAFQLKHKRLNEEYLALNEDYAGWVKVDGTVINYPYVHFKNNDFYFRRGFDKKRLVHGTIFMDYRNDPNFTDKHTVLYGHAMLDGTMFRALDKYKSKDFFEQNQTIEIRTLNDVRTYRIFSAYVVDASKRGLDIPGNDQSVESLISLYKGHGRYKTSTDTSDADHVLTLVSCNYDIDNGRIIVHAVLDSVVELEP